MLSSECGELGEKREARRRAATCSDLGDEDAHESGGVQIKRANGLHPMGPCVRRPRRDVWGKGSRGTGGSLVFGIGKGMRKREHRGDGRACGVTQPRGDNSNSILRERVVSRPN
ncbi:hypothetical protein B296_00054243 [Ensete ventricosum]|uniref:Uncharacterized protein n=1 Tax=Ensete ventricosum TaxID=4639 RepID=A0A426X6Q9_ENSVE|nr:hypothetical protein B296_00054243 [Ensete ventricosum]